MLKYKNILNSLWAKEVSTLLEVNHFPTFKRKIEGNFKQSQTNVFLLINALTIKLTKWSCYSKVFASRDIIFHGYAYDFQKEDSQDVLNLLEDGIENAKLEEIEGQ